MSRICNGQRAPLRTPASLGAVLLGALAACSVTNTGNPSTGNDAPKGLRLVRSELQRDTRPELSADERARFTEDSEQFAFDMYAQVKDGSDNLFYSPYSISLALAMAYAGARGDTEREMASALRFGLPQSSLHAAFNATDLALQGRAQQLANPEAGGDGFALRVTNASFAQQGLHFEAAYLDVLAQQYDAGMYLADFAGNAERERNAINQWVLERTQQRIPELLPQGALTADAVLVLVNAIYFKASWLDKFDPEQTAPATFHAADGDVQVQMMHGHAERYARGDGYQALELPYVSPDVRVLFILPDEGQLANIEGKLERSWFEQARQALDTYNVDLRVPRFRFDAHIELRGVLQALGMRQGFTGDADFSGISGPPGELYIDQVYHKAFVAMDEQGTEAAAATAVVVGRLALLQSAVFTLDRPFIFVIFDEPSGQILFLGRLSQPSD